MSEIRDDVVESDQEKEGDVVGSSDFIFRKIGDSIPLKSTHTDFDLEPAPLQALAISERYNLIFLAHAEGFYVAKTKDAIQMAKQIKENGKGASVQEISTVEVSIGRVSILGLSTDNSTLAACVGGDVHFFSVNSLLNKEQKPSSSCSLGESGHVKDLRWRKNFDNSYVVLSNHGKLYHGQLGGPLKHVMDAVDAVDWSVKGDHLVVAKNITLSFLSSEFKQCMRLSLLSQSCTNGTECVIKVDTIKWVRHDSIVLGCMQLSDNGNEEGYLVQVITSDKHEFTEASCKPMVLSFNGLFTCIVDDILPGGGPYLFASYLEHWELVIAANRKNTDQHIVSLGWSLGENQGEAVAVEFRQDKDVPRIELTESGDDNFVVGFGIDKASLYEKITFLKNGGEHAELSPYCILMCLSSDGKLIMFHVARLSDTSVPSPLDFAHPSEDTNAGNDSSEVLPLENELSELAPKLKNHGLEAVVMDGHLKQMGEDAVKEKPLQVTGEMESLNTPAMENDSSEALPLENELSGVAPKMKNHGLEAVVMDGHLKQMREGALKTDDVKEKPLQVTGENESLNAPAMENDSSEALPLENELSGVAPKMKNHGLEAVVMDGHLKQMREGALKTDDVKEKPLQVTGENESLNAPAIESSNLGVFPEKTSPLPNSGSAFRNYADTESQRSSLTQTRIGGSAGPLVRSLPSDISITRHTSSKDVLKSDEVGKGFTVTTGTSGMTGPSALPSDGKLSVLNNFSAKGSLFAFNASNQGDMYAARQASTKEALKSEVSKGFPGIVESTSFQSVSSRSQSSGYHSSSSDYSTKSSFSASSGSIQSDTAATRLSTSMDALKNEASIGRTGVLGSANIQSVPSWSQSTGHLSFSNNSSSRFSSSASSGSTQADGRTNVGSGTGNATYIPASQSSPGTTSSIFSSGRATQGEEKRNASIGSGNANPITSISSSMPGKSFTSKGSATISRQRAHLSSDEPELSKNFFNVNEMVKELDTLLSYIQEEGGFRDACTVFQKDSVLELEEGLVKLSERCRTWKSIMDEQLKDIEHLQDKTVQVLARKIYVEGILRQASDKQYWDLWNRQKLNPEFELKHRQIEKLHQTLMNQLIELESHFNTLEINRFADNEYPRTSHRTPRSCLESSRGVQSVYTLYNAMKSQLSAAEQLSECLSKQMAFLNIESPAKKNNVAKELFESIGLAYDDSASFQSPIVKKIGSTPDSNKIPVYSSVSTIKEIARRNPSDLKGPDPETARRRRDSLDRSWTSFAPQKTTVKRMFQEERSKVRTEKPSFKITQDVFNSKIEEGPSFTRLENDTGLASSLVLQSVNKDQPNIKTVNRDNSKPTFQASETSSGSLFKWAKDHSGAPQIGQSNSPVKEGQKAHLQPMSSSVTILNNAKAITAGSSSIRHNPATQTNLFTIQAGPDSETKSTVQSETPVLNQNFSRTSSTTLLRKTLPHKETVNLIPQTNEMSNMKITQSILPPAPTFSTFNHQSSSQSSLSIPESSHPSLSSVALGGPSSRYKPKDRNQTASASSSVPYSSFSSTTASLVSPAAPSSVSPTALSSVSQTASSTFHFQLQNSEGSLPIHPPSKDAEPVGPHPHTKSAVSEINSSSEPSLSLTPETKVTAFSVSLPTSATTTSSCKPEHVSPTSSEATTSSFNISSAASSASITSGAVSAVVAGSFSGTKPSSVTNVSTFNMFGTAFNSSINSLPAQISSGQVLFASPTSGTITETKIEGSSVAISQEDEMEEEAPDTTDLSMAALGGFGLGSAPAQTAPKSNPFGGPFAAAATAPTSSPFSLTAPSGELFRPASFGFQSLSPPQSSQPINQGVFSSGFGANNSAPLNVSGFGQPAQIGAGQQALGSVLGAFGQSRQLGTGLQGVGFATPSGFAAGGGGFANTATGGGFAGLSSTGGSFAGIGSGGGGFAAAAVPGGGGFAGASLAPAAGGFSAFGSNPGAGGFSSFGGTNTAAAGKPPQLFTQMRK